MVSPTTGFNGVFAHARLFINPFLKRVGRTPHAQRAGEQYWRLDLAKLADLGLADHLAVAVTDVNPGGNRVRVEIAGRGNDGGDAGPNVITFDFGHVPDKHALDIGNRVVGSRSGKIPT